MNHNWLRKRFHRQQSLGEPAKRFPFFSHFDRAAFGEMSEAVARFLGTGRYLFIQTFFVIVWISLNGFAVSLRWDPYPFILLNLAFSTQAAYAAPLILLAQNRQATRDKAQEELDRQTNRRTQADAEFLARELASVRIQLSDSVSHGDLDVAVERIISAMERRFNSLESHSQTTFRDLDSDTEPKSD